MRTLSIFCLLLLVHNEILAQEYFVFRAKKIQATPDLVYQPGELLIRGSKIIRVGQDIEKPKKFKLVNWQDHEIYPGLISPGSS